MTDQFQPTEEQSTAGADHNGSAPPDDDVLNIITSVQAELDRLKSAQERQATERAVLEHRQLELDQRERTLTDREAQIDQRRTSLADQAQELARKESELSEARRGVERAGAVAAQRAQEIEARQAALTQQEQAQAQRAERANHSRALAEKLRRARLRRIRQELRRRADMISQAKEALVGKAKEADHILEQRRTIAQAQIELDRRTKKLETRAERSRGMSVLFLGVIVILGLGVMSWTIVSRVVPATYIASATLAADDSSGALSSEQLDAWQEYCVQLASDPRLMEIATDRMSRRGILEFANAATLSSKMRKDLDLASPAPGQLTLSLTGLGADRTERILDTFIASLVSAANDAQERRLDDASTIVVEKSTADRRPINDPRLIDTAIVWGASVAVVLLLALGLWTKLSIALRKFDQESQEMLAAGGRPF